LKCKIGQAILSGEPELNLPLKREPEINSRNNFQDLIIHNLERIKPYLAKNRISAYRLINNAQKFPPVTVDIYQDNAVIHVFSCLTPDAFTELEVALQTMLQVNSFFYKDNSKENLTLPVSSPKKIIQEEYGHKFLINLSDYLDTGLFLDHRETRKWIAGQSQNKIILNTFGYSGSFTVYAANNGALKTYSVDISSVYCDWIKENLALNKLPLEKNWVYKMDSSEFFKYAKKKNLIFDIIIVDPPTFSKNKGKSFSVQKDHPRLINGALEVLSPSGLILFSSNYRDFRMVQKDLLPCLVKEKLDTIPPDFAGTQPHRCFIIRKRTPTGSSESDTWS
jgi:23S rRNA (cytosine1962-C5)-methyltransferase